MARVNVESILEAEGHLVDSQILTSVFDAVIRHDSAFEVLSFDIGRTNEDYSRLRFKVLVARPGRACRRCSRSCSRSAAIRWRRRT